LFDVGVNFASYCKGVNKVRQYQESKGAGDTTCKGLHNCFPLFNFIREDEMDGLYIAYERLNKFRFQLRMSKRKTI
jgi:hypothetical protein